jgi:hypothetical protein
MKRNLLYNCYAAKTNKEWELNIQHLNKYADIFNGRRLVLIKTGKKIVESSVIKSTFSFEAEFIYWPNDKKLCEVAGFVETLSLLESKREDEITFYAHTKGSQYNEETPTLLAVRDWRNKMYDECLKNPQLIDEVLSEYACAGCFRLPGYASPPLAKDAKWHFSGTFWWVNHNKLFSNPKWKIVEQSRWGVESYLGQLFDLENSYCFYNKEMIAGHNLYSVWVTFECECGHVFEALVGPALVNFVGFVNCPKCSRPKARMQFKCKTCGSTFPSILGYWNIPIKVCKKCSGEVQFVSRSHLYERTLQV